MPKRKQNDVFLKWFPVMCVICSAVIGAITWVGWFTSNIPKMSYVDELSTKQMRYVDLRISETIKYADDKITAATKQSFDHSDINKGLLEAEYKGISSKIDMLIMMVQAQQVLTKKQ